MQRAVGKSGRDECVFVPVRLPVCSQGFPSRIARIRQPPKFAVDGVGGVCTVRLSTAMNIGFANCKATRFLLRFVVARCFH